MITWSFVLMSAAIVGLAIALFVATMRDVRAQPRVTGALPTQLDRGSEDPGRLA